MAICKKNIEQVPSENDTDNDSEEESCQKYQTI